MVASKVATHTPGPWMWSREYDQVFGRDFRIVANVSHRKLTTDEDEANSRLIAAAPDFLEALIAIGGLTPHHDVADAINIARAAIAKVSE